MVSPAARRRVVDMLKDGFGMSERFACRVVGLSRSTYRRVPVAATPADPAGLRGLAARLRHETSVSRVPPCLGVAAVRREPRGEQEAGAPAVAGGGPAGA